MNIQLLLANRRKGFSLIEVMMGLVILLIALAAAAALAINNARLVSLSQQRVHAANLAEYKLEELRNANWNTLANGTDSNTLTSNGAPGGIFTRSWAMIPDSPETGLKTMIVTVNWNQFGATQNYVVSGVLAP